MKDHIIFKDAGCGIVSLSKEDQKNFTFEDSKGKKSLIANIQMTHSGIVTLNKGFYLPSNMKAGADSFTDNYNKPVLIGHDSDTDPVGRVIEATYVDTSSKYRMEDSSLSSMMEFLDKAKGNKKAKEEMIDFVHHVMDKYISDDSYKGMGHILGRLKIDDEETIQKILDGRYLTVSVAMAADSAYCSECGQDWVSEGPCDHDRGQIYDSGYPVALIPGKMRFNHVGIVSEPADIHAAGFSDIKIVKGKTEEVITQDCASKDNCNSFADKYANVVEIFSYGKNELYSLRDNKQLNLLDIKDEIESIEKSVNKTEIKMKILTLDEVTATLSLYKSGENKDGKWESTEVSVRKYVEDMDEEAIKTLAAKALTALSDSAEADSEQIIIDTVISEYNAQEAIVADDTSDEKNIETEVEDKVEDEDIAIYILDEKFKVVKGDVTFKQSAFNKMKDEIKEISGKDLKAKEITELADALIRTPLNDVLFSREDLVKETLEDSVKTYIEARETRLVLADAVAEEIAEAIDNLLEEGNKLPVEIDDAAKVGAFPVVSKESAAIAQSLIRKSSGSLSLKGRLIGSIAKKASQITEEEVVEDTVIGDNVEVTAEVKTFKDMSNEELVAHIANVQTELEERDLTISDSVEVKELKQEISILELQLDAANDEAFSLQDKVESLEGSEKERLATTLLDKKIEKNLISDSNKGEEFDKLMDRTEGSLKDSIEDLTKDETQARIETLEKIEDPTFNDEVSNQVEIVEGNDEVITIKDRKMKRAQAFLKANKK